MIIKELSKILCYDGCLKKADKVVALLLLILFTWSGSAQAQHKSVPEYQVKAAFVYNFTRFVNWPDSCFNSPEAPFVIGIVGNDPFGSYLDEIVAGEKVGNRPIEVQRYSDIKDIGSCQILYINIRELAKLKTVFSKIDKHHILTVSDTYKFTEHGGQVGFFKEKSKIRIQINMAVTKESNLEISSKLLRIAKLL